METGTYKVGIIGAGGIVETAHLPVLKVHKSVEVSWFFDKSKTRTDLISRMFSVTPINESEVSSAIRKVDICLITIPYGVRDHYIKLCSGAEKAVYVEKPFAKTTDEHNKNCSAFPAYKLAVGFQRRAYRIVNVLKHIIENKFFGQLEEISFEEGHFNLKSGKEYISNSLLSGGGVIIESAIHSLDQILLIANAKDVSVQSIQSLYFNGIDYDSEFKSVITIANGEIPVNCIVSSLRNLENTIELKFQNAIIKTTLAHDAQIRIYNRYVGSDDFNIWSITDSDNLKYASSVNHSFFLLWDAFLKGLANKTENMSSASTSLLTTTWIDQIYSKIRHQ